MRFTTLLTCLLAFSCALFAEDIAFQQQLLLPDGTPAANVPVLVRILQKANGNLQEERTFTTDAQGNLSIALALDGGPMVSNVAAYAIIDVPGCALTLVSLTQTLNDRGMAGRGPGGMPPAMGPAMGLQETKALSLQAAYQVQGRVLGEDKQPAAGAVVTVVDLDSGGFVGPWRLNYPHAGIATPALTAVTGADGTYALRGFVAYGGGRTDVATGRTAAVWTQDGAVRVGDAWINFRWRDPASMKVPEIILVKTAPLRGTVSDAVSGQPVAGAKIHLVPRPGARNRVPVYAMAAESDAQGRFLFPGVPAIDEMVAVAEHPHYGGAWIAVAGNRFGRISVEEEPAFKLRPLAPVAGRLQDAETGQPLRGMPLELGATYDPGYDGPNLSTGPHSVICAVREDGTFSGLVPAGEVTFRAMLPSSLRGNGPFAPGIQPVLSYYDTAPSPATIPAGGSKDLVLSASRRPMLFVHFAGKTAAEMQGIIVCTRGADGREQRAYPGIPYWARPVAAWGEKAAFRVLKGETELLPWTELAAEQGQWVTEVKLP